MLKLKFLKIRQYNLKYLQIIVLLLFLLSCTDNSFIEEKYLLGTICRISVFQSEQDDSLPENIVDDAFNIVEDIENRMSFSIQDSEIYEINNNAGIRPVKVSEDILFEDLCFDCQQSVEKALKALLISWDIEFPRTHSIGRLLELVNETGVEIPETILKATELTEYAVSARYPSELEEIGKQEYEEALEIAIIVFDWTRKIVENELLD